MRLNDSTVGHRRRLLSVGVLCVASMMFLGCHSQQQPGVTIGAALSLTGSASVWGQNTKNGMDLALEEINSSRGGQAARYRLVYEDTKSEPRAAVDALHKLIAANRVPVVIGDIASSNVLAMAPVAEAEKIVLISPGASNPDISFAGEYIFRNFPSDALEGKVDAGYAYEQLKWRNVAVLNIRNAYGEGVSRVFKQAFASAGGKVVLEDSFDQGTVDFRGLLTKVKSITPDGVFLAGYPDEMAKLLVQSVELAVKTPVLSTQAFDDPQVLKIAGHAADGVVLSTPAPPSETDPTVSAFRRNYKQRFGKDPGLMSDTGYDALKIVVQAIDRGGYSGAQIKQQLESLKNYPGAAGFTTFDQYGDVPRPVMFRVVKDAKFQDLDYRVQPR